MVFQPRSFLRYSWLIAVLCVAFVLHRSAFAQSDLLSDLRASFRSLDYVRVERLARSAIEDYSRFAPTELAEVHRVLGLSYFYQGMTPSAREQFEAALSLDPAADLDPLMVPPQAIAFYEEVRRETTGDEVPGGAVRYIMVFDPRPAAAIRSLLVPGWGQLYKDDRTKGAVLLGAWSLTSGGSLAMHFARRQARQSYERAVDPGEIADRYDRFNTLHKLRNNLVLAAGAIWIYGAVDALLTGSPAAAFPAVGGVHVQGGGAAVLQIRF